MVDRFFASRIEYDYFLERAQGRVAEGKPVVIGSNGPCPVGMLIRLMDKGLVVKVIEEATEKEFLDCWPEGTTPWRYYAVVEALD